MDLRFTSASPADLSCDLLAVAVGEDFASALSDLDGRMGGQLLPWLDNQGFDGKPGAQTALPTLGNLGATQLLLLGVGDGGAKAAQRAAASAGRVARKNGARRVGLSVGRLSSDDARLVVENFSAGNYVYDKFKRESDRKAPAETLTLIGTSNSAAGGDIRARAQTLARDLVNAPAEELYPESLANIAKELAHIDGLEVEVWDIDRCIAEGCVGIEAVGRGSDRKGCLIHVTWRPAKARGHVALVGKGVTFDAGGLSLKPSPSMQTMRCDMGGAATMLATIAGAAELGLPVAIDCFIGAVENLLGGRAFKLGDVLAYPNGVSVEIHNTDAEGRLVLADCLIQASKVAGATHIVDAATLTGAAVIALGTEFTALYSDSDALAESLVAAANENAEGLWRMPLHAPYAKMLQADWGTLKNVGGRDAGSITAALFLKNFVAVDKTWAHLDIAGPAFIEKENARYAAGGTGEMVRSLLTWLEGFGR